YGIGDRWDGTNTNLKGMADISSAFESPYTINADNPASFSFLKLTTYEAGAEGDMHTLNSSTSSYGTGMATLSYMNIGIPVGKHFGFCIGLKPLTRVYYNLADTNSRPGDSLLGRQVIHSFSGDGSVNLAYLGVAYQYKGFSIGVQAGYMFGHIDYYSRLINNDTTYAYNSTIAQSTGIGGIYWKAGLLYETKLNKNYTLRVGGTLSLQQSLQAKQNEYWIASYNAVDTFISDTTYNAQAARGTVIMPMTYSFGIQLARNDKWMVGLDYTSTQWNQFRNFGQVDSGLASSTYRVSLGGELTPDATSLRSFLSRVTYRLGVYYGTGDIYLNNTTQYQYGVTFGGSLPFHRSTDQIHFAFDIGKLGTTSNGLLQDNYVKFSLGISLNDRWFIPHKYD
ncbi:MAG: hypothetical protein ACTHJ0_06385, partial [Flavipsychrobacter sp.]